MKNQTHLLKSQRFLPLFITQFFGAFNDNVFKNAFLIWFTYDIATKLNMDTQLMVTIASELFVLPFFLFSALAGQIADKFEKSKIVCIIKIAGEMVSLTATEVNIAKIDPKSAHAIVAIPDPKKGEQLVLMTTSQSLKRSDISTYFKENQITELSVPKEIIAVEKLPLLGTGKIDYVTVKNIITNQTM